MGAVGAGEGAGAGAVTTAGGDRGRGTCVGVLIRLTDRRGVRSHNLRADGAVPIIAAVLWRDRAEMRLEDRSGTVLGGTGVPGGDRGRINDLDGVGSRCTNIIRS